VHVDHVLRTMNGKNSRVGRTERSGSGQIRNQTLSLHVRVCRDQKLTSERISLSSTSRAWEARCVWVCLWRSEGTKAFVTSRRPFRLDDKVLAFVALRMH
jgi:hypothetical protein